MPPNELITGYAEEVRTYIPSLKEGVVLLGKESDPGKQAQKIREQIHTIKGASLMMGIPALSHMAGEMETALDDLISGRLPLTKDLSQTMNFAIERMNDYCQGMLGDGAETRRLVREAMTAWRRLRNLPPEKDRAVLGPILEGIPEYEEGGPGAEEILDMDEAAEEPEAAEDVPAAQNTPEPAGGEETDPPEIMPELLESFYEEAKEHMEDLDRFLNALESQIKSPMDMTPDHKEIVRRIRRSVHTVKGAGAVIGLSTVSGWGHTMEDFLDWLFEGANQITPDIVSLLMESGDLLAGIIANPRDPQKPRAAALKSRYGKIMGESGAEEPPAKPSSSEPAPDQDEAVPPPFAAEEQQLDVFSKVQTLRVGTERVDQIVNLISELMISASALERQMTIFTDVLGDLEISKDRLRGIAREMEREYEVKALESLKPVPGSKAPRPVSDPDALSQEFEDFDSLELDRYSKLSMIIRTLNESVIDVRTISNRMVNLFSDFDGHLTRQRVLLSEVQDKMMGIRMLPMGSLSNKLRRTVREISSKLKKKIRLVIEGEDIELDRMVWDKITDPLMHLLRNAADHGVERPDVRRKIGKPPTALIHLTASREGNQVVIRMTDDGGGLNYEGIRRKAIRGGFIREGSIISKKDLAALIFKPGLSTCDTISEVSGRGVGMDVVRENVQDLKGTVQVLSQESKGTQFIIRIPLTLAAVRALLFTLGPQIFAVALSEIREIVRASSDNLIRGPQDAVIIGNEILPLHPLRHLLHITGGSDESPSPIVLVVEAGGKREALEIDAIVGQQEIVIKNTGSHLRYIKGISGVTIIGDGGVVPILNVSELISGEAGVSGAIEGGAADFDAMTVREKPLSILVVDDSISIRQVISRLMEDQGWAVRTAKDGLDALDKLKEGRSDLIILDIEMPRMNGYELLGTLSEDPDFQNIPVVMLTSRATAKHRDKALSLGAKGFMGKPFKNDEFIDLIIQLTRSRR